MSPLIFLHLIVMGFTPCIIHGHAKTPLSSPPPFYMDVDKLSPFSSGRGVETRRKNRLSHRFYELFNSKSTTKAQYRIHSFSQSIRGHRIFGHRITVSNAREMLSILEPLEKNGCNNHKLATVLESSKQRDCLLAINAGFFNERTGQCFGNLVSDGEEVNKFRGLKSANFGIRKDGSLVVGYLKETDLLDMRSPFEQLVSGVGWIIRNGESYLNESLNHEQCNIDNLQRFFTTPTSRTMIGHDNAGDVHIVQVDGRTGEGGISLYDAVELLLSFGLVNAVNLNGAGSSTLVVNGTIVNYPSNVCTSSRSAESTMCAAKVSSILCVHQPDKCVEGRSCTPHGHCYKGRCKCNVGWAGEQCEKNTDGHLAACCWRNHYIVVVLCALVAASIVGNIVLCDVYLLYRFRSNDLASPKRTEKDKLRTYLKENAMIMSSNEDMLSEQRSNHVEVEP